LKGEGVDIAQGSGIDQGNLVSQGKFVEALFGVSAQRNEIGNDHSSPNSICDTTQSLAPSADSVAGPVDKETLLEAFDSEIEVVEA